MDEWDLYIARNCRAIDKGKTKGLFTQKYPRTTPQKIRKKKKSKNFFEDLGVNNPSISVFKSFFKS